MNEFRMEPWEEQQSATDALQHTEDANDDRVKHDNEATAWSVLSHYSLEVHALHVVSTRTDQAGMTWRCVTNQGDFGLKRLHEQPQQNRFRIAAQDYLSREGAQVPAIFHTREGQCFVEAEGQLWMVFEWIDALEPLSLDSLDDVKSLCEGLGQFHDKSKGFTPPTDCLSTSRLNYWPRYYDDCMQKMRWLRTVSAGLHPEESGRTLLAHVEWCEQQAQDMLQQYHQSPYRAQMIQSELPQAVVHRHFEWKQSLKGDGGSWFIDLNELVLDCPIRQLRECISSTMDELGRWDAEWVDAMIEAYCVTNPLEPALHELLRLDLSFPHELFQQLIAVDLHEEVFAQTNLEALLGPAIAMEQSKRAALGELGIHTFDLGADDFERDAAKKHEQELVWVHGNDEEASHEVDDEDEFLVPFEFPLQQASEETEQHAPPIEEDPNWMQFVDEELEQSQINNRSRNRSKTIFSAEMVPQLAQGLSILPSVFQAFKNRLSGNQDVAAGSPGTVSPIMTREIPSAPEIVQAETAILSGEATEVIVAGSSLPYIYVAPPAIPAEVAEVVPSSVTPIHPVVLPMGIPDAMITLGTPAPPQAIVPIPGAQPTKWRVKRNRVNSRSKSKKTQRAGSSTRKIKRSSTSKVVGKTTKQSVKLFVKKPARSKKGSRRKAG